MHNKYIKTKNITWEIVNKYVFSLNKQKRIRNKETITKGMFVLFMKKEKKEIQNTKWETRNENAISNNITYKFRFLDFKKYFS